MFHIAKNGDCSQNSNFDTKFLTRIEIESQLLTIWSRNSFDLVYYLDLILMLC